MEHFKINLLPTPKTKPSRRMPMAVVLTVICGYMVVTTSSAFAFNVPMNKLRQITPAVVRVKVKTFLHTVLQTPHLTPTQTPHQTPTQTPHQRPHLNPRVHIVKAKGKPIKVKAVKIKTVKPITKKAQQLQPVKPMTQKVQVQKPVAKPQLPVVPAVRKR